MKQILIQLIIIASCATLSAQDRINVKIKIADDVDYSGQSVYIFGYDLDSELVIFDSCYIRQSERELDMVVAPRHLREGDHYSCDIIFEKKGAKILNLYPRLGENITVYIDSQTPVMGVARCEGSPETELQYRLRNLAISNYKKLERFQDSLTNIDKQSLEYRQICDSITKYDYYSNVKRIIDNIEQTNSPSSTRININIIKQIGLLPQKSIDSLVTAMKARFPNDKAVQIYPGQLPVAERTDSSIANGKRRHKLITSR